MHLLRILPLTILVYSIQIGSTDAAVVENYSEPVDARSYQLGIIGAFGEVVRLGVKDLALSEPMTPEEMDSFLPDARVVANRNHVLLYRESDLLVSDLYPAEIAAGKDVLLIYQGDTLEKYLALKAEKIRLLEGGGYQGDARRNIALQLGRLLSYPESVINDLISQQNTEHNSQRDE